MNNELFSRVKPVFADILSAQALEALGPGSSMDNTEGWDSLNFLQVIMGIESEFGIRIDGLDAANMVSIANILQYLEEHTQVGSDA